MALDPDPPTMKPVLLGGIALVVGVFLPLGLLLVALALPSVFALYNAVPTGQMLAVALMILAGYLFLRTPGWVRSQHQQAQKRSWIGKR